MVEEHPVAAEAPKKVDAVKEEPPPAPVQPAAPKVEQPRLSPEQEFADRVNKLIDDATAAGLRPLPVVARILAKRGMSLVDQARVTAADVAERFLTSLEGSSRAKSEKK